MSYQDKEKSKGLIKKVRPIRALGKGFGKLLGGSKKSKADKEAEEAAFKKRAHFAPKTSANDSNIQDSLENSKSFMELQNAYYENKEVQEPAKDISQYKSVHRDDYRATSTRFSEFESLEQPAEKD